MHGCPSASGLCLLSFTVSSLLTSPCLAQNAAPPDFGLDWVTVGAPGNVAFDGGMYGVHAGRGSVDYEYRISINELSTAQYMEFANTFGPMSDEINALIKPTLWGARTDADYFGPGDMYELVPDRGPDTPSIPVNMTWRQAAMYVNWLHNDKIAEPWAITRGAYDTSTFTRNADGTFNDQARRSPGAKFWIPSLDEYMKAAYYDSNRHGPSQGGWWDYPDSSDTNPVTGIPGVGESSRALLHTNELPFSTANLPIGSYPDTTSPWGLLDVSGGRSEWIEDWNAIEGDDGKRRMFNTSSIGSGLGDEFPDLVWFYNGIDPLAGFATIRVASAIPAPASTVLVALSMLFALSKRKRD